jgi:hypothetical protein
LLHPDIPDDALLRQAIQRFERDVERYLEKANLGQAA